MIIISLIFPLIFTLSACKKSVKVATKYEIIAEYAPETATLAGTAKITFENCGDGEISTLKFQLYPNAYRKDALLKPVSKTYQDVAYYAGESYGEMVISSVNGAKSWEVLGEDENVLQVHLIESLFPEDKIVLDVGFLVKLAKVEHRTGVAKNTVNLGHCFPMLCGIKNGGFYECAYYDVGDPFFSECADFKMTLTLPKEYTPVSTGQIVSERALERKTQYVLSATAVRDFAVVLSTRFKKTETNVDGTEISYYYYQDEHPTETLSTATQAFAYYEKTFGDYPYPQFTLAQTGLCVDAVEYPCLSLLSDRLETDKKPLVIARETARQWWYAVVGNNQLEHAWQGDGLAEYSAVCFMEEYEKYGFSREQLVTDAHKEYRSYYDVYGSVLGRTDTSMTRHLKNYKGEYEYECLTKKKGLVMFDMLRKSVGDKKFFAGLKKYYKNAQFTVATPETLIGAFEKTGLDVRGFFDSFLNGKAIL